MSVTLSDRVDEALEGVYDPCSVAVRAPISVSHMGLLRERTVDEDGNVRIRLCVTGPSCILVGSIVKGIEERLTAVPGVLSVKVDIDAEYMWTEEDMTREGRATLHDAREASRTRLPIEPRQWQRQSNLPTGVGVMSTPEPS
jgi:metal-sulfur cluster biosynthetic enzyme